LSDPSADERVSDNATVNDGGEEPIDKEKVEKGGKGKGKGEDYEDELVENVWGTAEIHDWATLRIQIKAELKKNSKTLPLSRINQLLILSNFATL